MADRSGGSDRSGPPVAILAEGLFAPRTAKTAIGALRYAPYPIVAIIDSTRAGADAAAVVGVGRGVPVVATAAEARGRGATVLLIGTASAGGRIPDAYRPILREWLSRGGEVWNGLHERVGAAPELAAAGGRVRELREPPVDLPVGGHRVRRSGTTVVLTVGSDAAVGKMTASLELAAALRRSGRKTAFVATGQTGIAIAGSGISVDAVVADFIAGAAERLVCDAALDADWIVVEGQGALAHPGFSGVTLGLLHGSAPDLLVLCTDASRTGLKDHPGTPLRPLAELVAMYEGAARWTRPDRVVPVVAVALNTSALSAADAKSAIDAASAETGLPACDPVRESPGAVDRLAGALIAARG
ncbi:MAG: DUF1611 domain-containing protein [Candidatus Limnocylindrales bacterium]